MKNDLERKIQAVDFRYDEGLRGRANDNLCPTITTHSSGFSGMPLIMESTRGGLQLMTIRKLTPKECMKLMGFEEKDYQAMRDIGMSDSQIWHCAGDSIVTTCIMALIGTMLPITETELHQKLKTYADSLKETK